MADFVDVKWFTPGATMQPVGIVKATRYKTGETVYYIGTCTPGFSEDQDIEQIMQWGAKYPFSAGNKLFGDE